jgi:hypothetical protein
VQKQGKTQNRQKAIWSETSKKKAVQKAQEDLYCIEARTGLLLTVSG